MGNLIKIKLVGLVNEFITLKWLILGIIIFLFGLNERKMLINEALMRDVRLNFWDLLLAMMSDIYLILYLIFPLLLFIMTTIIVKDFEHTILIRVGSYQEWIYRMQKKFMIYLIMTILTWLMSSILLSLGVSFSNHWSEASTVSEFLLSNTLRGFYSTPIVATMLQILGFAMTVFLIHTILCILYVFSQNKTVVYSLGVALFLFGLVSFKILPPVLKSFALPNYLVLYHGVSSYNSGIMSLLIIFCSALICFYALRNFDKLQMLKNVKITANVGILLYLILCVIGITYLCSLLQGDDLTIIDVWLFVFQGTSGQGYMYMSYLFYVIIFFGFIYLTLLHLEKEISELSYYKIIRYRSLHVWFWKWASKVLLSILGLLFLLMFYSFFMAMIWGFQLTLHSNLFPDLNILSIFSHFMINGFLQMAFYFLLFCIVRLYRKEDSSSSLVLIGLLTVSLIPGFSFIPVGLNGFGHLIIAGSSLTITLILTSFIIIQSIALHLLLNKRDY